MRKAFTAAIAALTFGATALTATAPAVAAPHAGFHGGGFHGGFRGRGFHGGPFFAGVAGLAIGAALADPYFYGPGPYYYGPYGPGPYYYGPGPGYGFCYSRARVWDPEIGRYVFERARVPC
jgi:hypothetical protein